MFPRVRKRHPQINKEDENILSSTCFDILSVTERTKDFAIASNQCGMLGDSHDDNKLIYFLFVHEYHTQL